MFHHRGELAYICRRVGVWTCALDVRFLDRWDINELLGSVGLQIDPVFSLFNYLLYVRIVIASA